MVAENSENSTADGSHVGAGKWETTAKGKGKVRPRKAQLESGQIFLPRLTAVAYK